MSGEMLETPGEEPRCYICNETGHKVSGCPEVTCHICSEKAHIAPICSTRPKSYFSYKCGAQGVTVRNCPECNPQQGNEVTELQ